MSDSDTLPMIEAKVKALEATANKHETRLEKHDLAISALRNHQEIFAAKLEMLQASIEKTATKDDVEHVVNLAVNGLLRDALMATPAHEANKINEQANSISKHNVFWAALMAIAGFGALIWSVLHGH
jgi:hypothetical protein